MWGILKNDFYTNKKMLLGVAINALVMAIPFFIKVSSSALEDVVLAMLLNAAYFFISFCLFIAFGNIITSSILQNEQTNWQTFMATTRTGKKGYITQKYILTITVYAVAGLYVAFLNSISNKLNGIHVSKEFILAFFLFFLFQAVLELPCILRFGTAYGNYIKIGLTFAVVIGLIIYALYGNAPIFSESNQEKMIDWALRVMSEGFDGPTAKKGILIAGLVVVGLYAVSYEVSILTQKKS